VSQHRPQCRRRRPSAPWGLAPMRGSRSSPSLRKNAHHGYPLPMNGIPVAMTVRN
jgi:hypothetical protein